MLMITAVVLMNEASKVRKLWKIAAPLPLIKVTVGLKTKPFGTLKAVIFLLFQVHDEIEGSNCGIKK